MRRLLGLGAVVGFVVALLLGATQSNIFNGPAAPGWVQAFTPWLELANEWRESLPLSTGDYYFFGRIFFVVYLLTIGGFVAWQQRTDTALPTAARQAIRFCSLRWRWPWSATSPPTWGGIGQFNTVQGLGFAVELLALCHSRHRHVHLRLAAAKNGSSTLPGHLAVDPDFPSGSGRPLRPRLRAAWPDDRNQRGICRGRGGDPHRSKGPPA